MKKAHVAEYKKRIVADFVRLIKEYPIIGALNVENLPAKQFQKMREQLRGQFLIKMSRKRLVNIAIENCKDSKKGIEALKEHLVGMPALIFSKESPFKLSRTLQKSKSRAPAKPGQIAPDDIVIKAGPTPFAPGPIIGELGSIGLKTAIEGGKVAIQREKVVAKKGEPIKPEVASILSRLGIMPMEIGLDLVAVYEKGLIYTRDILSIDESQFINNIKSAASESINLAVYSGYTTKDTIELLIKKAFNDSKALALSKEIISDVVIEQMISKAERAAATVQKSAKIDVKEEPKKRKEPEIKEKPKTEELKPQIEKEPEIKEKPKEIKKEEVKEKPKPKKPEAKIKEEEIKEEIKEELEIKEEPLLKDLEAEAIEAPKEKITDDIVKKTEEFVKQLQERAKGIREPEKHTPSANEIIEKTKKFAAGERPPTSEDILKEIEPVKKEPKKQPEKVPTAHELAKRRKKK